MGRAGGYRLGSRPSRARRERLARERHAEEVERRRQDKEARILRDLYGPWPVQERIWDSHGNPHRVSEEHEERDFDYEPTSTRTFFRGPHGDDNDPRWR